MRRQADPWLRLQTGPRSASARWLAFVAALAGTAVSGYLTYVHYTEPTQLSCPDTGVINCVRVTTSSASMLFGVVPVALVGLLFFAAMTVLTLPALWRRNLAWLGWARVVAATGGVGMALYLLGVELIRLHQICLWCTAAHLLAYVMFVSVLWASLVPPRPAAA